MRAPLVLGLRGLARAIAPDPIVEGSPEIVRLRNTASRFFVCFLWMHVPVVAAMATYNNTNVAAQVTTVCAIAAIATWAVIWDGSGRATRSIVGIAMTAMPIFVVYNGTGPWQIDYHMYFFAVFAMLVAYCDWRPIVAASALTAVHHPIFHLVDPARILPTDAIGGRVAVQAGIVALECAVLIWITGQLRQLFRCFVVARTRAEEAERRAVRYAEELEAVNGNLESFATTVAHDLRAPLRWIDGFSDALTEEFGDRLPPEASRDLGRISKSAKQLGDMVNALLDFSRLGAHSLRRELLMPADVAHTVLARLDAGTGKRRARVVIDELPMCSADPILLANVFQNMLDNALKFSRDRENPQVEVGALKGDPTIYYVRDNGVGFDMRKVDRLFNVFSRLHRADQFPGTGAGLATAKRIVTTHGGRIWAESQPDRGATFFFTLEPAQRDTRTASPRVPASREPVAGEASARKPVALVAVA